MKTFFSQVLFVAALLGRAAVHTAYCQSTTIPDAHGAYLTGTPRGELVMSWVEGDAHAAQGVVKFAVSGDHGRTFGKAVCGIRYPGRSYGPRRMSAQNCLPGRRRHPGHVPAEPAYRG